MFLGHGRDQRNAWPSYPARYRSAKPARDTWLPGNGTIRVVFGSGLLPVDTADDLRGLPPPDRRPADPGEHIPVALHVGIVGEHLSPAANCTTTRMSSVVSQMANPDWITRSDPAGYGRTATNTFGSVATLAIFSA